MENVKESNITKNNKSQFSFFIKRTHKKRKYMKQNIKKYKELNSQSNRNEIKRKMLIRKFDNDQIKWVSYKINKYNEISKLNRSNKEQFKTVKKSHKSKNNKKRKFRISKPHRLNSLDHSRIFPKVKGIKIIS